MGDIQLRIPLPKGASDATFHASHGSANVIDVDEATDVDKASVQWEMGQLRGGRECELVVSFVCPPKRFAPLARVGGLPAMDLQFMLPGVSASGIQLRYVKIIEKSGYSATTHISYSTQGVECLHRLPC